MRTSGVAMEGASSWGIILVQVKSLTPQTSLLCLDLGCVWLSLMGVLAHLDFHSTWWHREKAVSQSHVMDRGSGPLDQLC